MPARIIVVDDDRRFTGRTTTALVAAGHDVRAFTSSMVRHRGVGGRSANKLRCS